MRTVEYDDVDHAGVAVRRATDVDAGIGHPTRPHHQHADQRARLNLLRDDDARLGVRIDLLAVLRASQLHRHQQQQ